MDIDTEIIQNIKSVYPSAEVTITYKGWEDEEGDQGNEGTCQILVDGRAFTALNWTNGGSDERFIFVADDNPNESFIAAFPKDWEETVSSGQKFITSMKLLKSFPNEFKTAETKELIRQIKALYPNRLLRFEDFTDELAVYDVKQKRKFANLQLG